MHTALRQPEAVTPVSSSPGWSWLRKVTDDPSVRAAGSLWLASKIAIVALAWIAAWIMRPGQRRPLPWLALWEHWDAEQFRIIARYGYFGPAERSMPNQAAFLPGFPLLLRLGHAIIPHWVTAELAIGTVASFFAILGLVRLAEDYRPGSGAWAGAFLVTAPAAVFLAVGYSEALFLAFALPAWRAARRGAWARASILAACGCAIRVSGLFLLAGLVIMALLPARLAAKRTARAPALTALLTVPLLPVAGYEVYLHQRTGDWLAWLHAEQVGWKRRFDNPLSTFTTTWQVAFEHLFRTPLAFAFQLELVAVTALVVTLVVLLWRSHWPEACYCALTAAALLMTHWYFSVPRALLLTWPLWCGLAQLAQRHRLIGLAWLSVSAPLSFVTALLYVSGRWAG